MALSIVYLSPWDKLQNLSEEELNKGGRRICNSNTAWNMSLRYETSSSRKPSLGQPYQSKHGAWVNSCKNYRRLLSKVERGGHPCWKSKTYSNNKEIVPTQVISSQFIPKCHLREDGYKADGPCMPMLQRTELLHEDRTRTLSAGNQEREMMAGGLKELADGIVSTFFIIHPHALKGHVIVCESKFSYEKMRKTIDNIF